MAEWDADIAIDLAIAREAIATQFPDLAAHGVHAAASGWDNAGFRAGPALFRFPRRRIAVPLIEREIRWLPAIAPRLPVPVTVPTWIGRPSGAFPHVFAGYRWLDGEVVAGADPSEPERAALAAPLGAFLAALHRPAPADAPPDSFDKAALLPRAAKLADGLADIASEVDGAAVRALCDALKHTRLWEGPPTWVHGDFDARHLLLGPDGRLAGVIDWGDLHGGDPAVDLSVAYSLLPSAARPAFWAAYGPADDATRDRARFRALFAGVVLVRYGLEVGDRAHEHAGRVALAGALAEG